MDSIIQCPHCCSPVQIDEESVCQNCGHILNDYEDETFDVMERIADNVYTEKNM